MSPRDGKPFINHKIFIVQNKYRNKKKTKNEKPPNNLTLVRFAISARDFLVTTVECVPSSVSSLSHSQIQLIIFHTKVSKTFRHDDDDVFV